MSEILRALRDHADPFRASEMQAYHKTTRETLGVATLVINDAVKSWRAGKQEETLLAEAASLWASGIFEARIAAAKVLTKARFTTCDQAVWEMVASWLPDFDCWAIADAAAGAGGRRIMADLSRLDDVERWTRSNHLWTKRGALVFTLALAKLNHPKPEEMAARQRVLGWAAEYVDDPEWFIQKAVSWWLRTLSKHDPEVVRAFVTKHGDRMKAFARKDAVRLMEPGPK